MSITGEAGGGPAKVGFPVVDILTGLHAAVGILAALRGGRGQRVEVDLLSSLLTGMVNRSAAWLATGVVPQRMGTSHPSIAPYRAYRAADGDVAIAAAGDRQFRLLVTALGRGDLADDPRFTTNSSRVQHREELDTAVETALATAPVRRWVEALADAGVPAGPVEGIDGAFASARAAGLRSVVEQTVGEETVRTVADPMRLSSTPVSYRRPPPRLGEHDVEIRGWLDIDSAPVTGDRPR